MTEPPPTTRDTMLPPEDEDTHPTRPDPWDLLEVAAVKLDRVATDLRSVAVELRTIRNTVHTHGTTIEMNARRLSRVEARLDGLVTDVQMFHKRVAQIESKSDRG